MLKKTGFSLIEVLIAFIILALVVGGAVASYVSIKQLSQEVVGYRYTALNLAREMMEAGETGFVPLAGGFVHPFRLKYYYANATVNTLPEVTLASGDKCNKSNNGVDGIITAEGYGLKEWRCFCAKEGVCSYPPGIPDGYTHPFTYLGDIKAKGLVPKGAENSVTIYYAVEKIGIINGIDYDNHDASDQNDYYKQTVEITWQENGEIKKEALAGIPIRKVNSNDRLNTGPFSW